MNGRPLDDRCRRRLFLLAAAGVALVVFGLSLLHRHGRSERAKRAGPAPLVQSPPPPVEHLKRPEPDGLSRKADRRRVNAVARAAGPVARRFVVAFLAYSEGDTGTRVRAQLRATATPRFARRILSIPPRLHGRVARGRVVTLQVSEDRSPDGLPVVVTVRRGGRTTQLPLLLKRKDARWLVADLTG